MHERVRSLIRHVYAAAADETQWLPTLERLGDAFGGEVSGLQYRTGPDGHVRWGLFARLDPSLAARLPRDYAARNPWVRAMHPFWQPGVVMAAHHAVPGSELRRTDYYNDILRPAGLEYSFGACVFRRGDDVLNFTVVRSPARGPYERHQLSGVRALLPHLDRALQINAKLTALERTRVALADGLDRLHQAVLLVGRSGRVVFANRAADAIITARDGLSIGADGLAATAAGERLALRTLIDSAVRMSAGEGNSAGGAMRISRPSSSQPYSVLVAPLALSAGDGAEGFATVFVGDPERTPPTSEEVLRRLYGLSAAEARLATALAWTGSVERAADRLCITRGTARWHLKRIYRKTGAHHQAALTALVLRCPSRLAKEDA